MQKISVQAVRKWHDIGKGVMIPEVIAYFCPFCIERVVFAARSKAVYPEIKMSSMLADCPACNSEVCFISVRGKAPSGSPVYPAEICIHPNVPHSLEAEGFPDSVPESLVKSFKSAASSYNDNNYPATAVMARRTLEGIFKYLLPEGERKKNKPLAGLIKAAMEKHDFSRPLETLSHAIRDGGNLGAHFDEDNEPTEAMARQMIELLRYLISFIYVLPSQISELEESLSKAPPETPE
ncbi:DUF4145 domain-containing protein [Pseudomonas nitroreducens]|uniref:DUF4145 domain-containing protein n=1 Tax=Pseudomonas nitroreducens TaxID=46680 RepID=UPI00244982FC|nr:DUF4145 domain-containing protein [Pseudomonas nitroreducens]MDH1074605.1 DUF4145 domain-containing protein [Pseudomonas nitroreducens]